MPAANRITVTQAAVNLVMQDVEATVGRSAVAVVVGSPAELHAQLAVLRPEWPEHFRSTRDLVGWVLSQDDDSAIALPDPDDLGWEEFVVRVAETVQECLIEGSAHIVFPVCVFDGVHPMDAVVVGGVASWVCPKRHTASIAVGTYGLPRP